MARYYHQGIIFTEVSGRITGIDIAPGHRPTRDYSKYQQHGPSKGWTPATMRAMSRSGAALKYRQWRKTWVDIPGFERAQRNFRIAIFNFFREQREARWAGPDPGVAKAAPVAKPEKKWQTGKRPKTLDKPTTNPTEPWWVSPPTYKAPCHAQKICDITYQNLTPAMRNEWRRATTPLYRTPYDVFMHYNIPRVLRGCLGVPHPPERAGWKQRSIEQDPAYFHSMSPEPHHAVPDASCQTWGISWVHVQFARRRYWNGFEWISDYGTLWSLYTHVGLHPNSADGFLDIKLFSGYAGEGKSETIPTLRWPNMETNPIWSDLFAHSAEVTWTPARRHADGSLYDPLTKDPYKSILVKNLNTGWSWGHFRLPYPSRKCTTGSMSYWLKTWDPGPTETITPYI